MYCVVQIVSCQTGFSTTNMRFDKIFVMKKLDLCRTCHRHTQTQTPSNFLKHTHTHTHKTVWSLIYLL